MMAKAVCWTLFLSMILIQDVVTRDVNIQPKVELVSADSDIEVTCDSRDALAECEFNLDRHRYVMYAGSSPRVHRGITLTHNGGSLKNGECGMKFTFSDQARDDTYSVSCRTRGIREQWSYGYMMLYNDPSKMGSNFQLTPTAPDLTMNTTVYKVGDTLVAHCRTMLCHPPVQISWYLDREEITDAEEVPEEQWKEAGRPDIRHQMITRSLTARDNGKDVICRVHHEDISHDLQTAIKIFVEGVDATSASEDDENEVVTEDMVEEFTTTRAKFGLWGR